MWMLENDYLSGKLKRCGWEAATQADSKGTAARQGWLSGHDKAVAYFCMGSTYPQDEQTGLACFCAVNGGGGMGCKFVW